jgi:hypothetical protein
VLLPQKPDAVDHLLRSGARRIETIGETGILGDGMTRARHRDA